MNIGKSLRVSLAQKEMNQGQLAKEIGVTPQAISGWVRTNSMSLKSIQTVSNFFGVAPSEFIAIGED